MISESILQILVCPHSRQSLKVLSKIDTEKVGNMFEKGVLNTVGGSKVNEKPTELLIREDLKVAYPVRDGIPILLLEEGIDLSQLES